MKSKSEKNTSGCPEKEVPLEINLLEEQMLAAAKQAKVSLGVGAEIKKHLSQLVLSEFIFKNRYYQKLSDAKEDKSKQEIYEAEWARREQLIREEKYEEIKLYLQASLDNLEFSWEMRSLDFEKPIDTDSQEFYWAVDITQKAIKMPFADREDFIKTEVREFGVLSNAVYHITHRILDKLNIDIDQVVK